MTNAHIQEQELIARYLEQGDERLFEVLLDRYQNSVFQVALSVLGPYRISDAEDVVQEVFVRAHKGLAAFRGDSLLRTWLNRMAFNLAVDHTRKVRYRRPHLSEEVLNASSLPPGTPDPHQSAVASQRSRALHAAMSRLPSLYRSVLYLHYWLDCNVAEISEHLSIPDGSVKSYLQRGRAQLQKVLARKGWNHA